MKHSRVNTCNTIATNFPRQTGIIKGGIKLAVDSHSQHQKETTIHWDQNGFVVAPFSKRIEQKTVETGYYALFFSNNFCGSHKGYMNSY